jgi:hypothetical protein
MAVVLLKRLIQENKSGHCSYEDACATMEIFNLVRTDWERRNPDLTGESLFNDQFWGDEDDDSMDSNDNFY